MIRILPVWSARWLVRSVWALLPVVACQANPALSAGARDAASRHAPAAADSAHAPAPGRVTLTPEAAATAAIEVERARSLGPSEYGDALEVPGQVEADPRRRALVSPRVAGRLEEVSAVEGEQVRAGAIVARVFSREFLAAQADLSQAARRARALVASPDSAGADALRLAAERRLRLLGAGGDVIARAAAGDEPAALLDLTVPFAGSVLTVHALPGAALDASAPVLTIADLSVVDVVAEVPEASLLAVRIGQRADIRIGALPGFHATGAVERLRDQLNPETRTLRAVIHTPNPARALKPGMFAFVALTVPHGALTVRRDAVSIAERAVVADGNSRIVFVEVGPRTYERREVRVRSLAPAGAAAPTSSRVAVEEGIRPGEQVVVRGAFLLKGELAKAALQEKDE